MGHGKGTSAVRGGETGHERFEHSTRVPNVQSVLFGHGDLDEGRSTGIEDVAGLVADLDQARATIK